MKVCLILLRKEVKILYDNLDEYGHGFRQVGENFPDYLDVRVK
ncbi:hypothetical protein ABI_47110 [Asticcacaulis biprosthecium C19]|uniref:Uncharacterized protein n=1 Tax=Asticcacaulis biprosthecium C19 TaxID=715226 RepID=F4QU62_9CAUL|nr:hypothetical protein ABI_47110 [Asticcacaulis biprosthecium C19]